VSNLRVGSQVSCATDIVSSADGATAPDLQRVQQDGDSVQRHRRPRWWRHRSRDAHMGRHADKGWTFSLLQNI